MEWNNEYLVVGLIVILAAWSAVKGIIKQFTEVDHGSCSACSIDPKAKKGTKRRFQL